MEILPGLYWLKCVSKDSMRVHNIQVIVSDTTHEDVKHVVNTAAYPHSIISINELCDSLLKLYKRGISVGLHLPAFDSPALIIGWMILKLRMTTNIAEVNELLHVNYGLDLSNTESERLLNASKYTVLL